MIANSKFKTDDQRFWAIVKLVSTTIGYSERRRNKNDNPKMKRYSTEDVLVAHEKLGVPTSIAFNKDGSPTKVTENAIQYMNFRSEVLEKEVESNLMNKVQAKVLFENTQKKHKKSKLKLLMNKQSGEKRHPNYLANTVNLVAESVLGAENFDGDPMGMGLVVDKKGALKVLCRRMDGAYPSTHSPKILWEVKEYYGTTTFGSRIADGIYETMLVGEELADLRLKHGVDIIHVLFVDDHYTWWALGRSYLSRLIDMLHSGHVDAIFFGKEVTNGWKEFLESKSTK